MTVLILLQDNETPLQLAYDRGHKDINYLVKKTAKIDPRLVRMVLFSKSYASCIR